jgi:hypothetical protein
MSAGWSLVRTEGAYDAIDAVDQVSCRPDFAMLVYPGLLLRNNEELAPELRVRKECPPMFFAHAGDDPTARKATRRRTQCCWLSFEVTSVS